jgi:hypothetical protein
LQSATRRSVTNAAASSGTRSRTTDFATWCGVDRRACRVVTKLLWLDPEALVARG